MPPSLPLNWGQQPKNLVQFSIPSFRFGWGLRLVLILLAPNQDGVRVQTDGMNFHCRFAIRCERERGRERVVSRDHNAQFACPELEMKWNLATLELATRPHSISNVWASIYLTLTKYNQHAFHLIESQKRELTSCCISAWSRDASKLIYSICFPDCRSQAKYQNESKCCSLTQQQWKWMKLHETNMSHPRV